MWFVVAFKGMLIIKLKDFKRCNLVCGFKNYNMNLVIVAEVDHVMTVLKIGSVAVLFVCKLPARQTQNTLMY